MDPFTPEQLQYLEGRIAQLQLVQGPSHPAPPPASVPSQDSQGIGLVMLLRPFVSYPFRRRRHKRRFP